MDDDERAFGDLFDAATAQSLLIADLIALLVEKRVIDDSEARVLLFRSEGIIRFMPAASFQRPAYEAVATRLRERLGWHPQVAELQVTPLPPDEDGSPWR